MTATLERLRSTSASSAFQRYELAAEQAVAKLMPAITRKLGGKAVPTRSDESQHPRRNAALAAYLGAVHHSLMTIPTGVSVSAFRKRSDCQREWFVRLGGWFVTVKRTDDWTRKLR